MSFVTALRGGGSDTAYHAFTDYDNIYVYDTIAWPGGNYNRDGARICVIEAVSPAGSSGVTSATVSSDGYVRVYNATARLTIARNPASGGQMTISNGVKFADGGMAGTFTWSTVPGQPAAIAPTRTGRNVLVTISGASDDGGQTITAYKVQRAESSDGVSWGSWTDEQTISAGTYTYVGLTPAKYHKFRAYGVNVRGNGTARESSVVYVPASGKRRVSGTYQQVTIAKRKSGGVWQDLTIGKRKQSGVWVDLGS